MSELFNEQMTSFEARSTFFAAVDGKTKEEIEELKKEYDAVASVIMDREARLAEEGWSEHGWRIR
ncbi:MAG: hypothetical protein ACI3VA_10140 [Candidatus Limivicinus sp.]